MAGSGGVLLAKHSIESNDGRGGGGLVVHRDGADEGEVNGRGVDLGVFKSLLGEIHVDVIGEREREREREREIGGDTIEVNRGTIW
ncbi:hypothetical protein Tco_0907526 [Tanacetum coccineum]|uniref:Uncharacterized protein n=1 Tax=Tanacetum coccineum TaxID=301880 RepID=A0ABQ5CJI3_9ASTR